MRFFLKIISVGFILGFVGSCSTKELEVKNEQLQRELDVSKIRLNELELYVNDLREQLSEKSKFFEEEKKRIEDTYGKLNEELKDEIKKGEIEIENIKGILTINIVETIFFDSGSAEIKESGKAVLLKIGTILKDLPEKHLKVEGHTDNIPIGSNIKDKYPSNWELGAIRAVNVVKFLVDEAGFDPTRLSAASFSQYRPVRSNATVAGRRKNRRIELVVVDKQVYQLLETKRGLAK